MGNETLRQWIPQMLAISQLSYMGSCETKFDDAIHGKVKTTKPMQIGKKMHEKLTEGLPKISRDDILKQIKAGTKGGVRELPVRDPKLKLVGRIDQLNITGERVGSKSAGIVIDDKYPVRPYDYIPNYYKVQLAAYSVAVENSDDMGGICKIIGAELICRQKDTHKIISKFDVGKDELNVWESNIPEAVKVAWSIAERKRAAEHRRFDIAKGVWGNCWCGADFQQSAPSAQLKLAQ